MRILEVMAGNQHGGAETAFVDFCIAMKNAGQQIMVATRPNPVRVPALRTAGLVVHELPFGGPLDIYTPWALSRIVRDFRPQIVQTWMSRAAQKTPNWRRTKTPDRYVVVARLGGYYKPSHFKSVDYFNTITPDIKRHLIEGGIAADRIRHINNFAEMESVITPVHRADFNTPPDAPVLLSLARLHDSKALDILLRAVRDCAGVYLWLAGEGPARKSLETLTHDLGIDNRVRFLGWRNDRAALLQACDICVFASRVEPFGTVFVQAWAQQKPVIVSDADGPRQFCRDDEDCLMVPRDDVGALTAAIERMIAAPDLRARLVKRGYDRYQSEFTKEKTVSAYLDFFKQCLSQ